MKSAILGKVIVIVISTCIITCALIFKNNKKLFIVDKKCTYEKMGGIKTYEYYNKEGYGKNSPYPNAEYSIGDTIR